MLWVGALSVLMGLGACSSSSSSSAGTGGRGGVGGRGGAPGVDSGTVPTAANDTDASNPHVTPAPPASPNAPLPGDGGTAQAPADAGPPAPDAGGIPATWPTTDCVGGPCSAPNVCVNLDFLFVACVPCGGENQVCCPPYPTSDPFLGTCKTGLICASNPNFQDVPPLDLVKDVCQVPGSPPPRTGGFNNQRLQTGQ
jgi:hypothetical protein